MEDNGKIGADYVLKDNKMVYIFPFFVAMCPAMSCSKIWFYQMSDNPGKCCHSIG